MKKTDNQERNVEEDDSSEEGPVEATCGQSERGTKTVTRTRGPTATMSNSNSTSLTTTSNKRSTAFNKTPDVDDPPFSRLFLLIPKTMCEDELRQVFQVHGIIQDIHMVRDQRNQESKGSFSKWI